MKKEIPTETRALVELRDGHKCKECGSDKRLNIHHVIPEKYGGLTIPSNLVLLCRVCHSSKHIEYQAKYFTKIVYKINLFFRKFFSLSEKRHLEPILFLLTGQDKFRKYQREIIGDLMQGKDVLVVMPTGSGKSICFQMPAILSSNQSIVITPLKALMKDQVESLWQKRIPATFINSDLSKQEKEGRLDLLLKNLFKLIYVAPEQFYIKTRGYELKANHCLYKNKYSFFVVDEAHCIDKWGRNFRPPYSKLKELRNVLNNPTTIALTASASKRVRSVIINSLGLINPAVYVTGFHRPEINLYTKLFNGSKEYVFSEKTKFILDTIRHNSKDKIIIFVPTIKIGKELSKKLKDRGVNNDFYYGKKSTEERIKIQNEYKGIIPSNLRVLICTSAFGMGVNIPDIRIAIHWAIVPNVEDYYQQMGRIGRDGKKSKAFLLHANRDVDLIKYILDKAGEENPRKLSQENLNKVKNIEYRELQDMVQYVHTKDKWRYILDYFGEKKTEKKTWPAINFRNPWVALAAIIICWLIFKAWTLLLIIFWEYFRKQRR